jgi:hypothetical protein
MIRKTTIERAFEIAREGRLGRAAEIRKQLIKEGGYDLRHIQGRTLMKQLTDIAKTARAAAAHSTVRENVPTSNDEGAC